MEDKNLQEKAHFVQVYGGGRGLYKEEGPAGRETCTDRCKSWCRSGPKLDLMNLKQVGPGLGCYLQ